MDTQKIAARFRLASWGETVKERIGSGLNVEEFCIEKGISKTTYYYRQKKVREAACRGLVTAQNDEPGIVPNGWARLAEPKPDTSAAGALTVEINGCHITATAETDLKLLAKVCQALRTL